MTVRCREHAQRRADIGLACRIGHFIRLVIHAHMVGWHIEQVRTRGIRRWLLILTTERGGTNTHCVNIWTILVGAVFAHDLRSSGFHINMSRPVHRWVKFLGNQQLTRHTVHRVGETVAVKMHEGTTHLPFDFLIHQYHLVDTVIIPLIVRRHLIEPLRHAGIGVTGPDCHGPTIIARTLTRVPCTWVA